MKNTDKKSLFNWYQENKRPLPWRKNRKAYSIWISETMLQQTTVTAVIPFYEKFMKRFPTLKALAESPQSEVVKYWAGLGYYSRARNLHTAAIELNKKKTFPKSHTQLIDYKGFGPYTSRAVSSLAFDEAVGVLDGNVIRVLCRLNDKAIQWWKTAERNELQTLADDCVEDFPSGEMNQALMELGATICTPTSPTCFLCPLSKSCASLKEGTSEDLPLKKPKRKKEIWLWNPLILTKSKTGDQIAIVKNDYTPFLKGQYFLPGTAKLVKTKPKTYDFKHNITHHDIYVTLLPTHSKIATDLHSEIKKKKSSKWIKTKELSQWIPASLIKKAVQLGLG